MIGARLAELRKNKHLSQKAFGKLFNISAHTVSSYETERTEPSDALKIKMAEFLGVTVDYLVGATRESRINSVHYTINREKHSVLFRHELPDHVWEEIDLVLGILLEKNKDVLK